MATNIINPANLLAKIAGSKALKANDAAYQTIVALINLIGVNQTTINNTITNSEQGIIDINIFLDNLKNITLLTETNETAIIPASRVLTAGTNIILDATTPGELIVNASGSSGGADDFAFFVA